MEFKHILEPKKKLRLKDLARVLFFSVLSLSIRIHRKWNISIYWRNGGMAGRQAAKTSSICEHTSDTWVVIYHTTVKRMFPIQSGVNWGRGRGKGKSFRGKTKSKSSGKVEIKNFWDHSRLNFSHLFRLQFFILALNTKDSQSWWHVCNRRRRGRKAFSSQPYDLIFPYTSGFRFLFRVISLRPNLDII